MSDPTELFDLRHLLVERVMGAWYADGCLIDPGPECCTPSLLEGLGDRRPRAILLTHVHLDHAASAGALLRRWPEVPVYVHPAGAGHLLDPARLLASATRLFGVEGMRALWGDVTHVPAANVRVLAHGDRILGAFEVAFTPGHARHSVSYLRLATGEALVGDSCGATIPPHDHVLAPIPPPDFDLDAWLASLARIAAWRPEALCLGHFGRIEDPMGYLDRMEVALATQVALARRSDPIAYAAALRAELVGAVGDADAQRYQHAAPIEHGYAGVHRWLKTIESESAVPVAEAATL